MLIRIDDIKEEGITRDFSESSASFPVLEEMGRTGEGAFPEPIVVHLRAMKVGGMIEVDGRIETEFRASCSRCLNPMQVPLATSIAVTYVQELPEVDSDSDDEEVEVSAEDMGLILVEGEEIDLRDAIQEHVIMALPLRPLCAEDCKGLCSRCGADLNQGDCGCERADFNLKFAALKDFKVEKKDESGD